MINKLCLALGLLAVTGSPPAWSRSHVRFTIPVAVSPKAAERLQTVYERVAKRPVATRPATTEDWDRSNAAAEAASGPRVEAVADSLGVTRTPDVIGKVPVLRVRPRNFRASKRKFIYVHGGGYVYFSAKTSMIVPALIATISGDEVISVDYTLAPRATWREATDQIVAVWTGLQAKGAKPQHVGIIGDSAGGGLAAGSVLKMRDLGLAMPGAVYLISPWSDITATGDTYQTLSDHDPTLDITRLGWGAAVYASPEDQKHPYVSPVYGDYSKPFPPTLIQAGTREIFLSNAVRHYQAIRGGGHPVVLDIYEGMPHVFQALIPDTPETTIAITRAVEFLKQNLPLTNR